MRTGCRTIAPARERAFEVRIAFTDLIVTSASLSVAEPVVDEDEEAEENDERDTRLHRPAERIDRRYCCECFHWELSRAGRECRCRLRCVACLEVKPCERSEIESDIARVAPIAAMQHELLRAGGDWEKYAALRHLSRHERRGKREAAALELAFDFVPAADVGVNAAANERRQRDRAHEDRAGGARAIR